MQPSPWPYPGKTAWPTWPQPPTLIPTVPPTSTVPPSTAYELTHPDRPRVQVVRNNFNQLLKTLVFALLLIYIFSITAYVSPLIGSNELSILDKSPNGLSPRSLLLNALFWWDYGFREGPVFKYTFAQSNVTAFEPPNNEFDHDADVLGLSQAQVNYADVFAGVLFNMAYHLVVILIFSAVVSGIIIDSFAELRALNNNVRRDIIGTCFICNIEREEFEQLNLPFKTHIKEEHNLWD